MKLIDKKHNDMKHTTRELSNDQLDQVVGGLVTATGAVVGPNGEPGCGDGPNAPFGPYGPLKS